MDFSLILPVWLYLPLLKMLSSRLLGLPLDIVNGLKIKEFRKSFFSWQSLSISLLQYIAGDWESLLLLTHGESYQLLLTICILIVTLSVLLASPSPTHRRML